MKLSEALNNLNKIQNTEPYLEILDEMVKIADDKDMCIVVVPERRIGIPYFKVLNHQDYTKATKVARIKFNEEKYVTGHKDPDGKEEWRLNSREIKQLIGLLSKNSRMVSPEREFYSNWKRSILELNYTKYSVSYEKTEKRHMSDLKTNSELETKPLPIDLKMPDYRNLGK